MTPIPAPSSPDTEGLPGVDPRSVDSSLKPALFLMSGRTVAFIATFFVPAVLARIFSQEEFGTYKQLFLVWATLSAAAQFGMAESLFYFLPLAPRSAGRYVANSVLFLAVSGLACLALLAAEGSRLASWLGNRALEAHTTFIGLFLVLMMVSTVLEIVMVARGRYLSASSLYGLSDLVRAAFLLVPVLLVPRLESLLVGAVVFAALRFGSTIGYFMHAFGADFRPQATLLRSQLAYAAPFALAVLVDIFQSTLHQYAVSYHFDAATFAVYSVGCLQIPFVEFAAGSACNVMMVRMSEAIRDGRTAALPAIWHSTTRQLALILFPVVGLLLTTAHPLIVFLFTEQYAASVPIFMIGSTSILLTTVVTAGVLRVHAETRFILLLNVVKALVIVSFIHSFVAAFHLAGAMLVTVLAGAVATLLALVRIKALMRVDFSALVPWPTLATILGVAVAASVAARMVEAAVDLSPLPALILTGFAYTATYLGLLLIFGLLTEQERLAVTSRLRQWTKGVARIGDVGSKLPRAD